MDAIDQRLAQFRAYVPDPAPHEAADVAWRTRRPRRPVLSLRYLIPAAGVVLAGALLALLVSRNETPRSPRPATQPGLPGQTSTSSITTDATASTRDQGSTSSATVATDTVSTPPVAGTGASTSTPPGATTTAASGRACSEIVVATPGGGPGLIYAISDVHGIGCGAAQRIVRLSVTKRPLPSGWWCDIDTCWQGGDPVEAFRRLTYTFGGDAG